MDLPTYHFWTVSNQFWRYQDDNLKMVSQHRTGQSALIAQANRIWFQQGKEYQFWRYQDENLKIVSQNYRAWPDWTHVQADLALYWWQRLITFGSSRIRYNWHRYTAYSTGQTIAQANHIWFQQGKGYWYSILYY